MFMQKVTNNLSKKPTKGFFDNCKSYFMIYEPFDPCEWPKY